MTQDHGDGRPAMGQRISRPSKVIPYAAFLRAQARSPEESEPQAGTIREREPRVTGPADTQEGGTTLAGSQAECQEAERTTKITQVRTRILEGYYDRPEVLAEVVQRLLESFDDPGYE